MVVLKKGNIIDIEISEKKETNNVDDFEIGKWLAMWARARGVEL